MKMFEYKKISEREVLLIDSEKNMVEETMIFNRQLLNRNLTKLGTEGWELVSVMSAEIPSANTLYFKRELIT